MNVHVRDILTLLGVGLFISLFIVVMTLWNFRYRDLPKIKNKRKNLGKLTKSFILRYNHVKWLEAKVARLNYAVKYPQVRRSKEYLILLNQEIGALMFLLAPGGTNNPKILESELATLLLESEHVEKNQT